MLVCTLSTFSTVLGVGVVIGSLLTFGAGFWLSRLNKKVRK